MRCEFMVQAVSREEGDGDGLAAARGRVLEDGDGRGRCAPWCCWLERRGVGEVGKGLQAGAADHCDLDGVCVRELLLVTGIADMDA